MDELSTSLSYCLHKLESAILIALDVISGI